MGGLVSEGSGQPAIDRIGLDEAATPVTNGPQSSLQGRACDATFPVFFENSKAGDSPEFSFGAFGGEGSIFAAVVDARKLRAAPELTPSDRLSVRIDERPLDEVDAGERERRVRRAGNDRVREQGLDAGRRRQRRIGYRAGVACRFVPLRGGGGWH